MQPVLIVGVAPTGLAALFLARSTVCWAGRTSGPGRVRRRRDRDHPITLS